MWQEICCPQKLFRSSCYLTSVDKVFFLSSFTRDYTTYLFSTDFFFRSFIVTICLISWDIFALQPENESHSSNFWLNSFKFFCRLFCATFCYFLFCPKVVTSLFSLPGYSCFCLFISKCIPFRRLGRYPAKDTYTFESKLNFEIMFTLKDKLCWISKYISFVGVHSNNKKVNSYKGRFFFIPFLGFENNSPSQSPKSHLKLKFSRTIPIKTSSYNF